MPPVLGASLPPVVGAPCQPANRESEDVDLEHKAKKANDDACPREWTTPECMATILAVMAANRVASESCSVLRAHKAAELFIPEVRQRPHRQGPVDTGMQWRSGVVCVPGHSKRCVFPSTGKNRGSGSMQNKVDQLKKDAQNVLDPLHRKCLNHDGSIPKEPPRMKCYTRRR